jgi:hypothetical protein
MTERLCGPDCQVPEWPHAEPITDWIGDTPILHCDSERPVPGTGGWNGVYNQSPDIYCLCGHPGYATCPAPGPQWWREPISRSGGEATSDG